MLLLSVNIFGLCNLFSTINEPQIISKMGYYDGLHAPGYRLSMLETLDILHALAKAHALAVPAMRRAAKKPVKIGFSSTGNLCYPCSENEADICAARTMTFANTKEKYFYSVITFSAMRLSTDLHRILKHLRRRLLLI